MLTNLPPQIPPIPPVTIVWKSETSKTVQPSGPVDWSVLATDDPRCASHESRLARGNVSIVLDRPAPRPIAVRYKAVHSSEANLNPVEVIEQRTIPAGVETFQLPYQFKFHGDQSPPYRPHGELMEETIALSFLDGDYNAPDVAHIVTMPARKIQVSLFAEPSAKEIREKEQDTVAFFVKADESVLTEIAFKCEFAGDALQDGTYAVDTSRRDFTIPAGKARSDKLSIKRVKPLKGTDRRLEVNLLPDDAFDIMVKNQSINFVATKLTPLKFSATLADKEFAEGNSTTLVVRLIDGSIPDGIVVPCVVTSSGNDAQVMPLRDSAFTADVAELEFKVSAIADKVAFEPPESLSLDVRASDSLTTASLTILDSTPALLTTMPVSRDIVLEYGGKGADLIVELADGVIAKTKQEVAWILKPVDIEVSELVSRLPLKGAVVEEGEIRGRIVIPAGEARGTLKLPPVDAKQPPDAACSAILTFNRSGDANWQWKADSEKPFQITIQQAVNKPVTDLLILVVANNHLTDLGLDRVLKALGDRLPSVRIVDNSPESPFAVKQPENVPVTAFPNDPGAEITAAVEAWKKLKSSDGPSIVFIIWAHPEEANAAIADWSTRPDKPFFLFWLGGRDRDGRNYSHAGLFLQIEELKFGEIPVLQTFREEKFQEDAGDMEPSFVRRLTTILDELKTP